MKNLKVWVALLIVVGIMSIMPFVPEGAPRFAIFGTAVAAAIVMYVGSHRKTS